MAVYNPYDQVIFDDPAYLTDPEKVKEQLQEETRGIADVIARTAGPIAGLVTDPEGYQQTLDQEQRNKQILEQLGITNRQLTRDELERAKAAGYDPLTTGQALGKISGFLYSDLVKGSENIRSGVDYYDLPENERMGVAMGLIDLTDIALLPAVFKKLATIGVKKFGGKTNLKTIAQDPEIQKEFPAETQEILSITGGGFVPEGVMREADMGGSGVPKYLPGGKYNPAFALEKKMIRQAEDQKKKLTLLEDYYTKNPTEKSVSGDQLRVQLQELLPEGELAIKPDTLIKYAEANPDTAIGKAFKKKLTKEEQVTDDVLNTLREEAELRGETIPINTASKITGIPQQSVRRLVDQEIGGIEEFVQSRRPGVTTKNIFHSFFPSRFGESSIDQQTNYTLVFDAFRSGRFGNIDNFQKEMKAYGIEPKRIKGETDLVNNPEYKSNDPQFLEQQKQAKQNFYNDLVKDLDEGSVGYKKLQDKITKRRDLSVFTRNEFPNLVMNNPGLKEQFVKEFQEKLSNKYKNTFKEMYDNPETRDQAISEMAQYYASKNLNANMAHVMEIGKIKGASPFKKEEFALGPGLRGKMNNPEFYRINFAAHNIAYQKEYENIIEKSIQQLNQLTKKDITKIKPEALKKPIEKIQKINQQMINNNMAAYIRLSDVKLSDRTADVLKNVLGDYTIAKEDKGKSIFLGAQEDKSLSELKNIFQDRMARYVQDPKSFKISKQKPEEAKIEDEMFIYGSAPYIKKGFPLNFAQGGPVKMALGGDPLANMNQQQFTPDPAFDEDYFQQAVDSGNLQAANIFNLFKVFKKPKVMATPSNIKQVEEANQAMPQAVPGSQEIAPMQPGRPDFFFKSFLLDQLNSKNAPKASTPQGWREFLIKGRNVPEAEMLDTGILQYLEDTEKFYPNKKITREDIESLYDMSPLGNLEVRVKESTRRDPAETFVPGSTGRDLLDFDADQGRAKHKGAGRVEIDNAADDYFEVVVNVPQLPGQEKAFINSGHFEEPNVLGFTRVGTYKNVDNQPVAVIQEMQTDMLTEVRKEQERLSAMVKALTRYRNKLVNDINNMPPQNTGYYENELRIFDQKYPPDRLAALESDSLIQPFPNVVAKDLIPEKTRSLNQIQENINQLSMANVEQYMDPAYKTKIFDLAQEQQKIVDDLMSMNRTSNYEEMLRDFKVPNTTNRGELDRIANTDTYLPSDYNLKKLESFPPIPFNKQADYVDLLIKSTIKAAKQKGIDKVAIMPADVGPNPRWGKDSDEAKKKFQNLYDKVGVQQLKNIAKKYGGKLEVEKIIDSSKGTKGLTFLNKNPDGEFQILKQAETKKEISDADRDKYYDEQITRIVSGITEPGDVVYSREIAPGQVMDYYLVEGRGDATDVGYRMIPLKEGENANDALIKIEEYNPSAVDMYTLSFDPSKLEEPMYLFKKKSGGSIDKDSLVSITDIYGEYGR
jgi:hypothetical protein